MSHRSTRSSTTTRTQPKRNPSDSAFDRSGEAKRQKTAAPSIPRTIRTTRTRIGAAATTKSSKYFEQTYASDDHDEDELTPAPSNLASEDSSQSVFSAEGSITSQDAEESFEKDEDTDFGVRSDGKIKKPRDSTATKTKNKARMNANTSEHTALAGKELWREGVKTGLGPGKEVFIKIPGPRDDGGIPYTDNTLHPNTLLFLKDLKNNNDRGWLKRNDAEYRRSKTDWDSFVESLNEKFIEKDSTIPELPAKDLVFRIYRDIRFSKDATPYKAHFSAAWLVVQFPVSSVKGAHAHNYAAGPEQEERVRMLHTIFMQSLETVLSVRSFLSEQIIVPNLLYSSFYYWNPQTRFEYLAGVKSSEQEYRADASGLWMPEADKLALLRQDIDRNSDQLKSILTHPDMRREVFNGIPNDEEKAGYNADNPNIALLRLRSFHISKKIQDKDLLGPDGLDKVAHIVGIMVPLVTYLNSIVMPDPEDEDEEDEESDG
ncbi:hypothetical protein FQN57_000791 [Myotisia sp. PD_48]|nr:hypothetical protein FQN57_000791 [Myotisia sp. PD_48]